MVSTLQAISGAGHPGVSSHDILGNVIPFIPFEEEKSENETKKILGSLLQDQFQSSTMTISTHCNRVPVQHGHMACVSAQFETAPKLEEIVKTWEEFSSLPQKLELPSAPKTPLLYNPSSFYPQPKHISSENDMAILVGRLRECSSLDIRFVGLSHNAVRGAAGGGLLNMELLLIVHFMST